MTKKNTGLTKAQKRKFLEYLEQIENSIGAVTPLLCISQRVKDRQAQKKRNYLKAIHLLKWHVQPTKEIPNLKETKKYELKELHVHIKSVKPKVREIPKRKQLEAIPPVRTKNVSRLQIL